MCTFEIQTIVAKATLPTKSEFLSSQRIFHPLLILQVDCTSLCFVDLLTNLRCRRCLLTPCNEISMWKNAIIPHMEAQYGKMQIDPKYCFHQSRVVMYYTHQWHFFQKSALGYSTLLLIHNEHRLLNQRSSKFGVWLNS